MATNPITGHDDGCACASCEGQREAAALVLRSPHFAPAFSPPYRVISGRGLVDSRNRVVANFNSRKSVDATGYVVTMSEDAPILPGLAPVDADRLVIIVADMLNAYERTHRTLNAIHRELDGTEWNSDTIEAVAGHLRDAGYTVRDLIDEEDLQE